MKSRVLHIIATFIIVLGLVVIVNTSKVFAKEENVKYITELQVGDFIPANSVLLTDKTCVDIYHSESSARLVLSNIYGGSYDKIISLENNSSVVVGDYSSTFGTEENYAGWVVSSIIGNNGVKYTLKPVNTGNQLIQAPTSENDYSLNYQCSSGDGNYLWYRYKTIDDYAITPPGRTVWTANNGVYEVLDNCAESGIHDAKLTFHFNAEKGDVVEFEFRGNHEPSVYFNGTSFDGISQWFYHSQWGNYLNFRTFTFEVRESGTQELTFVYNRVDALDRDKCLDQVVIRNVRLLTKINDGNKLDTSNLNVGDNVYYKCNCSDGAGYTYRNSFQYKVNDGGEEVVSPEGVETVENPETIENPETQNNALSIGALIVIFSILMVVIGIKSVKVNRN